MVFPQWFHSCRGKQPSQLRDSPLTLTRLSNLPFFASSEEKSKNRNRHGISATCLIEDLAAGCVAVMSSGKDT